jgi:hypothetical protein
MGSWSCANPARIRWPRAKVVERRLGQLRKLIAEFGDEFSLHYKP